MFYQVLPNFKKMLSKKKLSSLSNKASKAKCVVRKIQKITPPYSKEIKPLKNHIEKST